LLISVIIPAYNEGKIIKQTLDQLHLALHAYRDEGYSWEIIVCDNQSTDKTAEIAGKTGAKIVKEPARQISKVRNTGAEAAQGAWLIFMDADTYPPPQMIAEVIEVIENGNTIGCGTTILVKDGSLFNKLRMERLNPFYRLFKICGGAFILSQREGFEAIKGFRTHLYAYEDIDFVFRLKAYGRSRGKIFPILYKNPVITSGRRGEYTFAAMIALIASNFLAVVLFVLQYFLPKSLLSKLGRRTLGYWYQSRQ
jgi:glycosyltransferase involved in cell wall biosynthesis